MFNPEITEGEWEFFADIENGGVKIQSQIGGTLCEVYQLIPDDSNSAWESISNAKAMVAVPELLKVYKAVSKAKSTIEWAAKIQGEIYAARLQKVLESIKKTRREAL